MKEHVFSLNAFSMPKVYEDDDANYILIIRLLLLEPGTFQTHPEMGIGVKSKCRYVNDDNFLIDLKDVIHSQMVTYLPSIITTEIRISIVDHTLTIEIDTTDKTYSLGYNTDTYEVSYTSHLLSDL